MKAKKWYSVADTANIMGCTRIRLYQKLKEGYFPNTKLCECERGHLIPITDIHAEIYRIQTGRCFKKPEYKFVAKRHLDVT